ncbi:MAG: transposase [Pyrinomonadaceae bacterium]
MVSPVAAFRRLARRAIRPIVHAVDGTENHVHLVATTPPNLLISEWIGKLKGGSSFYINHEIANRKLLDWQEGYGGVSFGTKDLKWVVDYVKNQKEHHALGTKVKRLERSGDEGSKGR